jgi:hypothetical protein
MRRGIFIVIMRTTTTVGNEKRGRFKGSEQKPRNHALLANAPTNIHLGSVGFGRFFVLSRDCCKPRMRTPMGFIVSPLVRQLRRGIHSAVANKKHYYRKNNYGSDEPGEKPEQTYRYNVHPWRNPPKRYHREVLEQKPVRTLMYVPGSSQKMLDKAWQLSPDNIVPAYSLDGV